MRVALTMLAVADGYLDTITFTTFFLRVMEPSTDVIEVADAGKCTTMTFTGVTQTPT